MDGSQWNGAERLAVGLNNQDAPILFGVQGDRDVYQYTGDRFQGIDETLDFGNASGRRCTFRCTNWWGSYGNPVIARNAPQADGAHLRLNEIFVRGKDGHIYHKYENGTGQAPGEGWDGFFDFGVPQMGDRLLFDTGFAAEPAVGQRFPDGALEMLAIGVDGVSYLTWQDPNATGGWVPWVWFGAPPATLLQGQPALATLASGGLAAFFRGQDNNLYYRFKDNQYAPWQGWSTLGASLGSDPVVGRNDDGRLEVFALDTAGRLCHVWQNHPNDWGSWAPWSCGFGGNFTAKPAVASNADGTLNVFVRGSRGEIWHVYQTRDSRGWSGFEQLGGIVSDAWSAQPLVVVRPTIDNLMRLYYVDGSKQIFMVGQIAQ